MNRGEAVQVISGVSAGAAPLARHAGAHQVKWSSGVEGPIISLPEGAVDCHHHIYDARYPVDPRATLRPADALASDYRNLQARLGIARHVIVQPSTYGTDNRLLLGSLEEFGHASRGIAVVRDDVPEADLKSMHGAGVRGVRFNLSYPGGVPVEMMRPLARRIADLGWHVQVVAGADRIVACSDVLNNLPVPVVFDHMGQIPSISHPAFAIVAKLLDRRSAWVKLSGLYTFVKSGPPYAGAAELARAYIGLNPDRLVWGSDWPHPTAPENAKPDDALMIDLISDWLGSEGVRKAVFADNPVKLYDF
ncbi:MAG: amidohydrolase family protein [Hyphomicrobiales bacterium]|nr:amidohydrolase family protein [Hyphomicrobiales bacterium]